MKPRWILAACLGVLSGSLALPAYGANISIHGRLFYMALGNEAKDSGAKYESSQSYQLLSGGACYFIEQSWCLGLNLLQLTIRNKSTGTSEFFSGNTTSASEWGATGLSVAYMVKPWVVGGVYYLTADRESGSNTFKTNLAWQIEAGYAFDVRGISVGPLISYMSFHYDEVSTPQGTQDLDTDPIDSFWMPSFAVWVHL